MKKGLFVTILALSFLFIGNTVEALRIPDNTTIYFDNNFVHWTDVGVYFYNTGDGTNSGWRDSSTMMSCNADICQFTLTSNPYNWNYLIFNSAGEQTVNLEYIGSNYIFKPEYAWEGANRKGKWYIHDTSAMTTKVNEFNSKDKKWYTSSTYDPLKTLIDTIPSTFTDDYLRIENELGLWTSSYTKDLASLTTLSSSIKLSSDYLQNKINELELKNLTGYTLGSIIIFRNTLQGAKSYIAANTLTEAGLQGYYDSIMTGYNNLIVTTEESETEAIEKLKVDIKSLQDLLKENTEDTEEIYRLCDEIEKLYEKLTNKTSDLSDTVSKLLENSGKDNLTEGIIKGYLEKELGKLNQTLNTEQLTLEDLEKQYKEIEYSYKAFLETEMAKLSEQLDSKNIDIEQLEAQYKELLNDNKELKALIGELKNSHNNDNALVYVLLVLVALETPLSSYLILKKIS